MPYSSFTIHPSQNRGADEGGESSLRPYLFLPSGYHQKYLVEINKPIRIWPIHRTIRYKIKQKSLFNSKLWSGPLCCQNNTINRWAESEQVGKEFFSGLHSQGAEGFAPTTGTCLGELPVPLGQSQEVPFLWRTFTLKNTWTPRKGSEPELGWLT